MHPLQWLRRRDAGLAVLRRAARTAIVMPLMFALGVGVIGNPVIATYAAFGSFALLLFVDFTGQLIGRVQGQVSLGAVGVLTICVGTLASRSTWLAAVTTLVVAFAVVFSGVVSSALAGAATTMLLPLVLSVTLPGPISSIPDRLAGWGLACAASLIAITVLWPAPAQDPLRALAAAACRALAGRLRSEVARAGGRHRAGGIADDGQVADLGPDPAVDLGPDPVVEQAHAAVVDLRRAFLATPYRPTGLSTSAHTLVRLVDELGWLNAIMSQRANAMGSRAGGALKYAAATVLRRGAQLLDDPAGDPAPLRDAIDELGKSREALESQAIAHLPGGQGGGDDAFVSSLDPSFRSQEISFAVAAVAANIDLSAAADRRSWWERLLGRSPAGVSGALSSAQERAAAHFEPHSVWLHNSVRAAIGLALAVAVARLTGVQHSFWVVLGTLSVLRSNALSTGQNVLRGLLGTVVGIVVGGVLVSLIGNDKTISWVLLPLAVMFAGLAPATISFAAGQAGFTVAVLVLFNIIQPVGWKSGIVRIEDVAIGMAVSLAVGLLFWPRGARAALRQAMAEAYADSAQYLRAAVDFGITHCDETAPPAERPEAQALRAAAAARRLDDAFRTYLGERGAKPVPLTDVTTLVTGVVGLRLAADAVLDLWHGKGVAPDGLDRTVARLQLQSAGYRVSGWYAALSAALVGTGTVPDALPPDDATDKVLLEAVERDLRDENGRHTATAVRMIWTGGHLDAARRLQGMLVRPARDAVARSERPAPVWSLPFRSRPAVRT